MQAVIVLLFPVALLPVFLAYWARYVFHSGLVFVVLLVVSAVVGTIFYLIAMDSAVSAAIRRRTASTRGTWGTRSWRAGKGRY